MDLFGELAVLLSASHTLSFDAQGWGVREVLTEVYDLP
jgi:hypothetical protein